MEQIYAQSNDGRIHLISAINNEYTLCGDAFDGHICCGKENKHAWHPVYSVTGEVTCKRCLVQMERAAMAMERHKRTQGKSCGSATQHPDFGKGATPEVILHPRPQFFIAEHTDNRVLCEGVFQANGTRLLLVVFESRKRNSYTLRRGMAQFLTN